MRWGPRGESDGAASHSKTSNMRTGIVADGLCLELCDRITRATALMVREQDQRSLRAHRHFATGEVAFDGLIPYQRIRGHEVLEIGVGSGFHAELLARSGAIVTGIDLTEAAVQPTRHRFKLKGLDRSFERWDAERSRPDFERRFEFIWSWGVIHHSSCTARIVRNAAAWLADRGRFSGMVYHRDSTPAWIAFLTQGLFRGRFLRQTPDEILWKQSDGFSARFYPAEQWRDLLLGFFEEAFVMVTGTDADALPVPRKLRSRLLPHVSEVRLQRVIARVGGFVVFLADRPLR
jgi:2-polyprenyl-3-methyl-5-hydroxy-6-metoxy-1,4-benzoquinol methylase